MKTSIILLTLIIAILYSCDETDSGEACDTCYYANDGECDDGSPGSVTSLCTAGTDCSDCQNSGSAGYNCTSAGCVYVSSNGQYTNLSSCESFCSEAGYNCTPNGCVYASSNAQYTSLSSCENNCSMGGYNCTSNGCVYTSSNAQYSSLTSCQNVCSTEGYSCTASGCQFVTSDAEFQSLSSCQSNCASDGELIIYSPTAGIPNNACYPIDVYIDGEFAGRIVRGGIGVDCGYSEAIYKTLPPGRYFVQAICTNRQWTGDPEVESNTCTVFSLPNQ